MAIQSDVGDPHVSAPATGVNLRQFPWWLVIITATIAFMAIRIITDADYQSTFFTILTGLGATIYTTIVAFVVALIIGMLFKPMRRA